MLEEELGRVVKARCFVLMSYRVLSTPGPHFYMSPVADMDLDADVDVVYNISTSVLVPPGSVAIILFWDAGRSAAG